MRAIKMVRGSRAPSKVYTDFSGQAAAGDEDIHLRKDGRGTRCFLNIHESHLDIEISGIRINAIIANQ